MVNAAKNKTVAGGGPPNVVRGIPMVNVVVNATKTTNEAFPIKIPQDLHADILPLVRLQVTKAVGVFAGNAHFINASPRKKKLSRGEM